LEGLLPGPLQIDYRLRRLLTLTIMLSKLLLQQSS
jgi:hypothetical protein